MVKSALGVSESVSVEMLLLKSGSVVPVGTNKLAVLTKLLFASLESLLVRVNTALELAAKLMVWLMSPEPLAAQLEFTAATHFQLAFKSVLGNASSTPTALASDGPALATVIV